VSKYKKEIQFLENIKDQMKLAQLAMPDKADKFKDDEMMYQRIIDILNKNK
jgi:hypothetical protein